ncbi:VOC family protein [Marivirga aurantiaca]|nr:VOC family protein [Marivirga aurantiaca]
MKNILLITLGFGSALLFGFYPNNISKEQRENNVIAASEILTSKGENMKLGAFSVSLSVKNIETSKQFYENLGFTILAGDIEKKYLIMKNENSLIGLFEGMFENNILTFNPGWDENGNNIEPFNDIREIQSQLKSKGIKIDNEIDPATTGPASMMVTDPDGNVILFDQHR